MNWVPPEALCAAKSGLKILRDASMQFHATVGLACFATLPQASSRAAGTGRAARMPPVIQLKQNGRHGSGAKQLAPQAFRLVMLIQIQSGDASMSNEPLVAVGLLTRRDLDVWGSGFRRAFPLPYDTQFIALLSFIDRRDAKLNGAIYR
jgi:hypothetical protein